MNTRKREGGFYAAKVRLFLNEYSGISLEEFCKAENVSYSKMCNCLGHPSYRKESVSPQPLPGQHAAGDTDEAELPELELKPLVIDMEPDEAGMPAYPKEIPAMVTPNASQAYVSNVRLRTARQTEITIGKCPAKVLAALLKEMEDTLC